MTKKQPEIRVEGGSEDRRLVEGKCAHCGAFVSFKDPDEGSSLKFTHVLADEDERFAEYRYHYFIMGICTRPSCQQPTILYSVESEWSSNWQRSVEHQELVHPKESLRPLLPAEVPAAYRAAYAEAAKIEFLSPTGAAFLAGRVLEQALRNRLNKSTPLVKLIDELLERESLSAEMHELMHDLREFRNIASHPGTATDGSVITVDQEEASYTLDVLAELLDYLYVRPIRQREMRDRHKRKKAGEISAASPSLPSIEAVKRPPPATGLSSLDFDDDDLPF